MGSQACESYATKAFKSSPIQQLQLSQAGDGEG